MLNFNSIIRSIRRWAVLGLIATLAWLQGAIMSPAYALFGQGNDARVVAPDGRDLTAMVDCLPKQLSEGDLKRAISEAGNDYLERVFQTKDNYGEYDISEAEEQFQACLRRQGIEPMAEANQLDRDR